MTPLDALEILNRVAEAHLLNGPDRRAVVQAVATLHAHLTAKPEDPAAPPASGAVSTKASDHPSLP